MARGRYRVTQALVREHAPQVLTALWQNHPLSSTARELHEALYPLAQAKDEQLDLSRGRLINDCLLYLRQQGQVRMLSRRYYKLTPAAALAQVEAALAATKDPQR